MNHDSHTDTAVRSVVNPYASSQIDTEATADPASLNIPAWIAIVCCVASLGFWLLALIVSLPYGHPNAPPVIDVVGFTGMFIILPGLGLAGAVSMLKRKRYPLSLIGASCMVVPLVGPCFGLTLPVGIWAIVLLRNQRIRDSFAPSLERSPHGYDNADDALAAASGLGAKGDWEDAVALYRSAAARWPEHANYIENCIHEIAKIQAAAT